MQILGEGDDLKVRMFGEGAPTNRKNYTRGSTIVEF